MFGKREASLADATTCGAASAAGRDIGSAAVPSLQQVLPQKVRHATALPGALLVCLTRWRCLHQSRSCATQPPCCHPPARLTGGRAWMPKERGGGEMSWISNMPGCRALRRRPAPPPRPLLCGRRLSPSPPLPPLLLPARPLSCGGEGGRRTLKLKQISCRIVLVASTKLGKLGASTPRAAGWRHQRQKWSRRRRRARRQSGSC